MWWLRWLRETAALDTHLTSVIVPMPHSRLVPLHNWGYCSCSLNVSPNLGWCREVNIESLVLRTICIRGEDWDCHPFTLLKVIYVQACDFEHKKVQKMYHFIISLTYTLIRTDSNQCNVWLPPFGRTWMKHLNWLHGKSNGKFTTPQQVLAFCELLNGEK